MTTPTSIQLPAANGATIQVAAELNGSVNTFHSVPEVNGLAVNATNPMPMQDMVGGAPVSAGNAKPVADINLGTQADAAWAGAGNGSAIAILKALVAKLGGTLTTADANGAAYQGVVAITSGVALAAGRGFGFVCTAAGNVTLTLADGSTITLALAVSPGLQTLPFAVTEAVLGSGTAATMWNLK